MPESRYKRQIVLTWNEIAPRYHRRVRAGGPGPFESTERMLSMAGIARGDGVLDVACGTGAVSKGILRRLGPEGFVVGIDASYEALRLAKRYVRSSRFYPLACDAERVRFRRGRFDAATCQFGLFFFANAQKALRNVRRALKPGGMLAMAVHGRNTPFYSSILDAAVRYVPEYREPGSPDMTRFSTKTALSRQARCAGFVRVRADEFTFTYSPGTFEQYWRGYLSYVPGAARAKIDALDMRQKRLLKKAVMENVSPYTGRDGRIRFPWQIVIATAKNP